MIGKIIFTVAILAVCVFMVLLILCLCKISGTHAEDDDLAWELLKNQEERKDK